MARRQEAAVRAGVEFATKPALARTMIARALDAGTPARWVAGDEVYGGADPGLRADLHTRRVGYVLAVTKNHPVTAGTGKHRAAELAAGLPARAWQRISAGPGAKGHRWYEWALVEVTEHAPGQHWLLLSCTGIRGPGAGVLPRLLPDPCRWPPWSR